jgi:hypothetical protein
MLPIAALAGQIRSQRAFAVEPPFSTCMQEKS